MSEWYLWSVILAISFATLVTRSTLHVLGERVQLPALVEASLRFAPACALAAIIASDLAFSHDVLELNLANARLLAGLGAAVIQLTTRSMAATIGGGMALYWVLRWLS